MNSHPLTLGRAIGVTFDHGEDFFTALTDACQANGITQGYIPMFLAGFAEARIVGTCAKLDNPEAPLWDAVHLENTEGFGCGTIAYDPDEDRILPHIHTSLGLKGHAATGHTSHLLSATVQFTTEMLIIEVAAPTMTRPTNPGLYNVPQLAFTLGIREL